MITEVFPRVNRSQTGRLTQARLFGLGLLVILAVYGIFFHGLGGYAFFDMDEPRYAEAARQMLETGNWVTPYFNGVVRFDKPVLHYWLVALSYLCFGVTEFSARFPSALLALGTVFALFRSVSLVCSGRVALLAGMILSTSLGFVVFSRTAITDMTLAAFITASILALFQVARGRDAFWILAAVMSALAALTKGPVGIVLPGLVLLVYTLFAKNWRSVFLNRWFAGALGLWLGLTLPWYGLAYLQNGQPFVDALLLHNLTRYQDVVSSHAAPWFFYLLVIPVMMLPWSLLFLPLLGLFFKKLVSFFLQGGFSRRWQDDFVNRLRCGPESSVTSLLCFCLVWAGVVFLFFTLAKTKLVTYILPILPPLAVLLALLIDAAISTSQLAEAPFKRAFRFLGALFILLSVASFLLLPFLSVLLRQFLPLEAQLLLEVQPFYTISAVVSIVAFGCLYVGRAFYGFNPWRASVGLSVTIIGAVTLLYGGLLPYINQVFMSAMLRYAHQAGALSMATYDIRRPSLTFYTQKVVTHLPADGVASLKAYAQRTGSLGLVVTKNSLLPAWAALGRQLKLSWRLVDQDVRYCLIQLQPSQLKTLSETEEG
ncbi:MAG: glycosyltransferase family 39 protein [Candidatus Melainabacteria bacterium]|nr:glycosyltransferase family 39 protein [Candidatus Melainabacteria bacterium]